MTITARILILSIFLLLFESSSFGAEPMSFKRVWNGGNCVGCEWVAAEGTITADTYNDFLNFAKREGIGKYTFVALNSPGGDLVGGLNLGRAFRIVGVTTSVGKTVKDGEWHTRLPGGCHSACSYAFLGGLRRLVSSGSKLGLHQFYNPKALSDMSLQQFTGKDRSQDQKLAAYLLEYVVSMGVDPNFVILASNTDPQDIYVLSEDEISTLGVDNYFDRYTPWKLKAFSGGLIAEIANTQDSRRMRLYCNQEGIYLTYLIYDDDMFEYYSSPKKFAESISETIEQLGLIVRSELKDMNINTLNRQVVAAKDENREFVAIILQIDKKTHELVISANEIEFDPHTVPRATHPIAQLINARISGDSRLPKLALKACIK